MKKGSKRPGRNVMVSSKINNLSVEELEYLDKLLHRELLETYPKNAEKIRRLLSAVHSQKNLLNIGKW